MSRRILVAVTFSAVLTTVGCASPIGTLSGVIRDGQLAPGSSTPEVRLVRGGSPQPTTPGEDILKGDTIVTGPGSQVVLIFQGDWEVVVDSNTSLYVVNPSTWLDRGRVFVRKLVDRAKEIFEVQDEHMTFAAEATQYAVSSDGAGTTRVVVAEGVVRATSKSGRLPPASYRAMEHGTFAGDSLLLEGGAADPVEVEEILTNLARARDLTTVTVPGLVQLSRMEAERLIASAGLVLGRVTERRTGQASEGTVLEQTPEAGIPSRTGASVALVVEAPGVRLPALTGGTREDAEARLEELGLRVEVREVERDDSEPGTVLAQSPAPQQLVAPGSMVRLTVAIPPRTCTVPEVLRLTLPRARARLEGAGLRVGQQRTIGDMNLDLVSMQDPEAGTQGVRCGSSVNLTFGTIG